MVQYLPWFFGRIESEGRSREILIIISFDSVGKLLCICTELDIPVGNILGFRLINILENATLGGGNTRSSRVLLE